MFLVDGGELCLQAHLCAAGLAMQSGEFLLEGGYEGGDELRCQQPILQSGQDSGLDGLAGDRDLVGTGSLRAIRGAAAAVLRQDSIIGAGNPTCIRRLTARLALFEAFLRHNVSLQFTNVLGNISGKVNKN